MLAEQASQELMEKISEVIDGTPAFEMLVVFSWLLGDMIVQTGADKQEVLDTLGAMIDGAVNLLESGAKRLN